MKVKNINSVSNFKGKTVPDSSVTDKKVSEPKKGKKVKQFAKSTVGITAGAFTYKKVPDLLQKVLDQYIDWACEGLKISKDNELLQVKNAVLDSFEKSGLKAKGFNLHNINTADKIFSVNDDMVKRADKIASDRIKAIKEWLPEKLTNKIKSLSLKYFKRDPFEVKNNFAGDLAVVWQGKNAVCDPVLKDIATNMDKTPAVTFHEMGHALNSTKKLGKILQSVRWPMQMVGVPLILATALLKRKKADGEKPKGFFDKTTTFIKNNAGKLSFAAFLPTLMEEGLADIRGLKLAKQAGLSSDFLKRMSVSNLKGWGT